MKHYSTFLFLCCFAAMLSAQNTVWFPPGAYWSYSEIGLGGPGSTIYKYAGNAVLNGQPCVKLDVTYISDVNGSTSTGTEYMASRNDSVFLCNSNGQLQLVYDFTRVPGQSSPLLYGSTYDHYLVVDTGRVQWQGISLRYQDVVLTGTSQNGGGPVQSEGIRIFERIGGKHLYILEDASPLIEAAISLNCYKDDEVQQCASPPSTGYVSLTSHVKAQWKETRFNFANILEYEYLMQGDTTVNTLGSGRKLYYRDGNSPTWKILGMLKGDDILERVYFARLGTLAPRYTLTSFPIKQWTLLYDYNIHVNDTLAWKPVEKVVVAIDSVQMSDGTFRQRMLFNGAYNIYVPYWIEGMGGTTGLFTAHQEAWTSDSGNYLRCYFENDAEKYSYSGTTNCLVNAIEPFQTGFHIDISPNPNSGVFTINTPGDFLPATITLQDVAGRIIYSTVQTTVNQHIDIQHIASGVVIAHLENAAHERASKLFLVR